MSMTQQIKEFVNFSSKILHYKFDVKSQKGHKKNCPFCIYFLPNLIIEKMKTKKILKKFSVFKKIQRTGLHGNFCPKDKTKLFTLVLLPNKK